MPLITENNLPWTVQDFVDCFCLIDRLGANYSFEWLDAPLLDGLFMK